MQRALDEFLKKFDALAVPTRNTVADSARQVVPRRLARRHGWCQRHRPDERRRRAGGIRTEWIRRSGSADRPQLHGARLRRGQTRDTRATLSIAHRLATPAARRSISACSHSSKLIQSLFGALHSEGTPGQLAAGIVLAPSSDSPPLFNVHNAVIFAALVLLNVSFAGGLLGCALVRAGWVSARSIVRLDRAQSPARAVAQGTVDVPSTTHRSSRSPTSTTRLCSAAWYSHCCLRCRSSSRFAGRWRATG